MNISSVSTVLSYLQQQSSIQREHNDLDAEVAESITRTRQETVDMTLEEKNKVAEQITEIKKAAVKSRAGSIDVWA